MIYAVIKIKGTQYKVSEGDEILIGKLGEKEKIEPEVLLLVNEGKVRVGKPKVRAAKVKIKVIEEKIKGKKITVQTFKAKSRYRRKIGFRPQYSKILVEKIS